MHAPLGVCRVVGTSKKAIRALLAVAMLPSERKRSGNSAGSFAWCRKGFGVGVCCRHLSIGREATVIEEAFRGAVKMYSEEGEVFLM